jgi:hypothetical protein
MKVLIAGPKSRHQNQMCKLLRETMPSVELVYERDLPPKPFSAGIQADGYWLDELVSIGKLPKRRK